MRGKGIFTRLFYANFGRPGNALYNNETNAKLMIPFTSKISEWSAYHYHETRVSGFGPFFGGILILSFLLGVWMVYHLKESRVVLILALLAIISISLISKHFWWPRFVPHMWFLPILPICISLWLPATKGRTVFTYILVILMTLNGLIVLFVHMEWETRSTIHLYKQLSELKQKEKPVEINYGYFEKATEEKLRKWGIKYTLVPRDKILKENYQELTSVVEGYPDAILFHEIDDKK